MNKILICLFIIVIGFDSTALADKHIAISLNRASEILQSNDVKSLQQATTLSGITRLRILIRDNRHDDLILVGEQDPKLPSLTLDDWAVALRSEFTVGRDPVVSIDQTPETPTTRKQNVRFEGALKNTQFGADMLAADITLKKLGLGKVSAKIFGVNSFLDLSAASYKKNPTEQGDFSRFWFLPMKSESYVFARNGIVVVEEYKIDIQDQRYINGKDTKELDPAVSGFSQGVRSNFGDLKSRFPSLARMEQLYYMTALVQGLSVLGVEKTDPTIAYWLDTYKVRRVKTPSTYPLEENSTSVPLGDGKIAEISLSGGIDLDAMVVNLQDGMPDALKEYVLANRPDQESLSWEVPLAALSWSYDIDKSAVESAMAKLKKKPDIGMSINRQAIAHQQAFSKPIIPTAVNIPSTGFRYAAPRGISTTMPDNHIRRVSPNVGGVLLEGVAQVKSEDGKAAASLATGNFALIMGDRDSRIHPQVFRKFITSLWSVYFGNTDPGISIDPIAPGAKKQLVRYIGRIQNTDLARVMREADYVMKKWSVGTERPDMDSFSSPDEYAAKRGEMYLNSMSRFWFVPKDMKFRSTGDALIYQDGKMTVQTEFLRNNDRGLKADPSNEDFARWFTENYPEVAKRYPVYQELLEYSKLVSLANYLKDSSVPLFWYLIAHRDLVLTEESPGTVDALKVNSKNFKGVHIEGGVQLVSKPQYILDSEARAAIAKAYESQPDAPKSVNGKKQKRILNRDVSISSGQEMLTFSPQHSLSSGVDYKGIRYQTDLSINEEGFILTDRSMETLSPQIHRYYLWETMRPIVSKMLDKKGNIADTEKFEREYVTAWKSANRQSDHTLSLLSQIKNKKYSDERSFKKDLKFMLDGEEYVRVRNIILKQAHYKTQFDLVRYYSPEHASLSNRQKGEFGPGWRLLIPYRLDFSEEKAEFRQLLLPKHVTLIDHLHGNNEIFEFRKDHSSGVIGYFPKAGSKTLGLVIALMTDGSLRLEDKLGAVFNFDADGRMTKMVLSDSHQMSVAYKPLTTFDVTPYQLAPVRQEGTVEIAGGTVIVPKGLQVTDSFQRNIIFDFDDESKNIVWRPRDKEYKGALIKIAMMTDGSFQLLDRYGNATAFNPDGEFQAVIPSKQEQYVAETSMGEQRLTFRYSINSEGRLCVNEAWAYMDASSDSPSYVIDYRYDKDLRLADHQVQLADGSAVNWRAN